MPCDRSEAFPWPFPLARETFILYSENFGLLSASVMKIDDLFFFFVFYTEDTSELCHELTSLFAIKILPLFSIVPTNNF